MTAPAGAPPGGGTKLDDLYFELSLRDGDFAEKISRNALALGALGSSATRSSQPLGAMDNGLRAAAEEAARSAQAFQAISASTDAAGHDFEKLSADAAALAENLKTALTKATASKPNTSGIDAINARIQLLARGVSDASTRAESLRKLEGIEAGLKRSVASGNGTLSERIRLFAALRAAQDAQQLPRVQEQLAQVSAQLERGNLRLVDRIRLLREKRKLEADERAISTGEVQAAGGVASAAASLKGVLAGAGIVISTREIIRVLGDATTAARQFQLEMAEVNTVAKVSDGELHQLGEGIKHEFRDLPVKTITELADGLYEIVSAGIPAGEALKFLDVATRSAIGGVTDVKTSVDGLTSAVNAYRASGLTVEQASDQMFAAVAAGKTTFGELAQSMGLVIGTASAVGVSFDEVLAVTAQLTTQGQSTAQTMTGLQAAIQNILRPADDFRRDFPQLAAAFDEGRLKGDGFVKFLNDFLVASNGSSAALKSLFRDTEAYRTVIALAADGGRGLAEMQERVRDSTGETAAAFKTINETAAAANQRLKNELQLTLQEIGTAAMPAVNEGLRVMIGLLREVTDQDEAIQALERVGRLRNGNAGASLGAFKTDDLRRYTQDVRDLFKDVRDGNLDLARMTVRDLKDIEDAFARDLSSRRKSSIDDFRTGQNIRKSLGVAPANADDEAYDMVINAIANAERAEKQLAAEREKNAAARRRQDANAIGDAKHAADEAADLARTYEGESDAAAAASRTRVAALAAITDAQRTLSKAQADQRTADAAGDSDASADARRRAEGARATIENQQQVVREAQNTLAAAAREINHSAQGASDGIAAAIAQGTKTGVDDAIVQLERYRAQVEAVEQKAGRAFPALRAEVERQRAAVDALAESEHHAAQTRITGLLEEGADSQVAAMQRALAELLEELARLNEEQEDIGRAPLYSAEQIAQLRDMRQGLIEATAAAEEADAVLRHFADLRSTPGATPETGGVREIAALSAQEDKLRRALELAREQKKSRAAQLIIERELEKVLARIKEIQGGVTGAVDEAARQESDRIRLLQDQIADVGSLASGVIDLAGAFGFLGDSASRALGEIVDVAAAVGKAAAAGDMFGVAVGALGFFGTALGSLTGQSPELQRAREEAKQAHRENIEALHAIESRIGDLDEVSVSGEKIGALRTYLDAYFDPRFGSPRGIGQPGAEIRGSAASGLTLAERNTLAAEFGVTIGPNVTDGLIALRDAMDNVRLTEFSKTFSGQMARFQASIDLLGASLDEPGEQLGELAQRIGAINGGGGVIGELLASIDTSTAAGIDAGRQAIRDLFADLPNLTAADLGGLTGEEFLQTMTRAMQLLDQLGPAAARGADRLSAALQAVRSSLEFTDQADAGTILKQTVKAARTAIPQLADILDGITLTTTDGLRTFGDRIAALGQQALAGQLAVDGFTADELVQALLQLEAAGDAAAAALGEAAQTIIGDVSFELDVLGQSNAAVRIREITAALLAASDVDFGEFRDAIASLASPDIAPADRDAIIATVLARLRAGDANTGTFDADQFRSFFRDLVSGTGATDAGGGTGGFNVDQKVTEETSARLVARVTTSNVLLAEIASATAATASAVTGGAFTGEISGRAVRDLAATLTAQEASGALPADAVAILASIETNSASVVAAIPQLGVVLGGRLDAATAAMIGAIDRLLPASVPTVVPPASTFPAPVGSTRSGGATISVNVNMAAGAVPVTMQLPSTTSPSDVPAITAAAQAVLPDAVYREVLRRLAEDGELLALARGVVAAF